MAEPKSNNDKEKREKGVKALMKVIDALISDDWRVVIGIESVENSFMLRRRTENRSFNLTRTLRS